MTENLGLMVITTTKGTNMKYILILCLFLVGCGEYKCINGFTAYRSGDVWIIPDNAYRCIEAKPQ